MPSVSAKQAKLMSAIKHGWQPPAGMHAPSLAVAREFHAADKKEGKFMHAKGGKISSLSTALDVLNHALEEGWGLFGHNTDAYRQIIPKDWPKGVTEDQARALDSASNWPIRPSEPLYKHLQDFMDKYSLHLPDVDVWRGITVPATIDLEQMFQRGKELPTRAGVVHATMDPGQASGFAHARTSHDPVHSVIMRLRTDADKAIYTPNPISGQSELMIAPSARYRVDDLNNHEGDTIVDLTRIAKAEGGKVSNLRGLFAHLRGLTDKYLDQHDPAVRHAVQTYQHTGETINNLLEGHNRLYSDVNHLEGYQDELFGHKQSLDELLANLDKAFKDAPLMPEDASLYRGTEPTLGLKPGYLSTTTSRQVAKDYADMGPTRSVRRIQVPGGTRILAPDLNPEWLDYSQREIIAPRGGVITLDEGNNLKYTPPNYDDGGKVSVLKPALGAIERRLSTPAEVLARKASQLSEEGHDPYNSADAYAKKAAAQAAADEFLPGLVDQTHWADGGSVRPWRHRSGAPFQGQSTDANRFLQLVSHAADRATSTVTDDPHHVLARVASGLASQVAGRTPTGGVAFGRLPNLVDEIKSLPAGLTDVGMVGSNVLGALAHKYLPHEPGSLGDVLPRLASAANAYAAKHGDPAPDWSRAAEERANAVHQTVNKDMGLSAPHGFVENAADATGVMLGQLPIPLGEAKTATRGVRGGLAALARAVPEYLGPTVRPSVRNYATGALGGGAMGALADQPDQNYYGGGRVSDVGNKIDWLTKKLGDLFASSPPPQPPPTN